jgi:hypothetical protein
MLAWMAGGSLTFHSLQTTACLLTAPLCLTPKCRRTLRLLALPKVPLKDTEATGEGKPQSLSSVQLLEDQLQGAAQVWYPRVG